MIAGFDALYSRFLEGLSLLIHNPAACAAVGLVQLFVLFFLLSLCVRMVLDLVATWRRSANADLWDDPGLLSIYRSCLEAGSASRAASLAVAPAAAPEVFSVGAVRPVIFLSRRLVDALDPTQLKAVLLHELAHLERRDVFFTRLWHSLTVISLSTLTASLALGSVYSHAVLHFGSLRAKGLGVGILLLLIVARRILRGPAAEARERYCDEWAMAKGADRLALASAILETGRIQRTATFGRFALAQTFVHRRSRAVRRAERLLASPNRSGTKLRPVRLVAITLLAAGALLIGSYHLRSSMSTKPPLPWSGIVPP